MAEKFYLSTAICYASSKPHIGNLYEAILADAICRYKRCKKKSVYFQTGTDEHGQKIEKKALENNILPLEHVTNISNYIKEIYDNLNISYDNFVRTTNPHHKKVVQEVFEYLLKKGDIYKSEYSGLYCVDCESFFTKKDAKDCLCPDCKRKLEETYEEAYFFKLSKYQDRLKEYIIKNKDFIYPEIRRNEMLSFLDNELLDLCVSRSSFSWGIEVLSDKKHVVYVWLDALLNYLTGVGYSLGSKDFLWPCDIHLIGKDILRFHAIYWPIFLMSLDLELPKKIFAHPWVLTNESKMSKSKGNAIYVEDLLKYFSKDSIRFYLLSEVSFEKDGNISYDLFFEKYNTNLANTYGNLISRTFSMAKKYRMDNLFGIDKINLSYSIELVKQIRHTILRYDILNEELRISDSVYEVINLLRLLNKYVDNTRPWELYKENNLIDLKEVIYMLLEGIFISSMLLNNIMPDTTNHILLCLGHDDLDFIKLDFSEKRKFILKDIEILFERKDLEVFLDIIKEDNNVK